MYRNSACKVERPKPGETITFKNFNTSMRVPFVIYTDIEAITENIHSCTLKPKNHTLNNIKVQTIRILLHS